MQVFKVYFKIIKANIKQIMIYLIIFLAIALIYTFSAPAKNAGSFSQTRINAAFINLGKDTVLTKGFKEYMSRYVNFVDIENNQERLQDALFFRNVEYIVTIPENFTEDFLQGKSVEVEKTVGLDSASRMYVDMAINKYFNAARVYVNSIPGIKEETLVNEVAKGASSEVQVQLKTFGDKKQNSDLPVYYFNYFAYSLFAILILGVSSNLMVFNDKNIKRRNLCSPMKTRTFSIQMILANLIFAFICYGVLTSFGFMWYREDMMSYNGLLLCINALVFTIAALSISYLAGLLTRSRNAQSSIANVLTLGFCFLSGVFVPQEMLSEKCLTIASFNPVYWYVKANNAIGRLSNFTFDNLSSISTYMVIELGFAIAVFSVALVVNKQMRITNS